MGLGGGDPAASIYANKPKKQKQKQKKNKMVKRPQMEKKDG